MNDRSASPDRRTDGDLDQVPLGVKGWVLVAADLETLVAQVWSPDVRPLADEAWRSYNAGAVRSSIVATWAAVSTDMAGRG